MYFGESKMKAEELAWAYLIREGVVYNKEWSYYAGAFEAMPKKTRECLRGIKEHGIDWSKTREPSDGEEHTFNGTFAEPSYTTVLYGTLVLNNGKQYKWGSKFEQPRNVFEVVAEFYNLQDLNTIVDQRLEQKYDPMYG